MNSMVNMSPNLNKDKSELKVLMLQVINDLWNSEDAGPFKSPVDTKVPGLENYLQIVKTPMDLTTIKRKIKTNRYKGALNLLDDVQLIWNNCKTFNADDSIIFKQAQRMEKLTKKVFKTHFPHKRLFKHAPQSKGQGVATALASSNGFNIASPVSGASSSQKILSKSFIHLDPIGSSATMSIATNGKESEGKSSKGKKRFVSQTGGSAKKSKNLPILIPEESIAIAPFSNSHHLEKLKQDEIFYFTQKIRVLGNEDLVRLVKTIDTIDPVYIKKASKDKFVIKIQDMDTGAITKAKESLIDVKKLEPEAKILD